MTWVAVCSARPRASVQNDRSRFGHQWWRRDVYHLQGADKITLCGRDSSEWLVIGPIESVDDNCCMRCRRLAEAMTEPDSR